MLPLMTPRLRIQQLQSIATPRLIQTWRMRAAGYASVPGGYTFGVAVALESHADLVRLVFGNPLTTGPWTLDRWAVAPSAKYNNGYNPVDASGAAVSWINGTCNNAGADTLYGAQASGSTAGMTIAAAADAANPTIACTDWAVCSTLDRADAGETWPLLFARMYMAGAFQMPNQPAGSDTFTNPAKWPAISGGRVLREFHQSGDFVTTPAGMTAPLSQQYVPPLAIQTYARGAGHTLMALGDSLTQGKMTAAEANGFVLQMALALSTPTRPVAAVNGGWEGQTMTQLIARGYREIPIMRPTAVIIETSTPNGYAGAQAYFDGCLAQALALAHYVRTLGIQPILKTAIPWGGYNATVDGYRKVVNARVVAMSAAGRIPVIDASAAVTDGATPERIQAQYLAGDSLHINDAGHAAIAAAGLPVMRAVLR